MGSPDMQRITDIQVDVANLYQEEMFTDMKVATIRRLTPIKLDGSVDESRQTIFSGQTNVLTAAGMLPVSRSPHRLLPSLASARRKSAFGLSKYSVGSTVPLHMQPAGCLTRSLPPWESPHSE